jgi:type IX secretion system PorP/SprF family membrane protein
MMKLNHNKGILLVFLILIAIRGNAQQEAQFTQYMYNTTSVNPAYAGSRDALSILGLYRTQWIGLEGAPQTSNFAVHSPVNDRLGLGLSILNDRIGPSVESNIGVDVSYNVPVSDNYRLFFGLKASANLLNVDFTKLDIYNPADPYFQYNIDNKFSPNIGAGVYLQSEKSYVGLSIPYMLATSHYDHSQYSTVQQKMHLYFIAGHIFDMSDSVKFKPSLLTKVVSGAPLQVDLSANFLINEKVTLGFAYRLNSAYSSMAGFQISDGLLVGYAYDTDSRKLGNYNSGSHEIFLRFELSNLNRRSMSPRFF